MVSTTLAIGEDLESTLQEQLHARIRQAILAGTLKAGTRLPSSRAFAKQQGVSRNTVLATYDQLIAEGYLETRRGSGTFVVHALPDDFIKAPTEKKRAPDTTAPNPHKIRTGLPAVDAFPMDLWARINSRVWRHADRDLLRQSDPMGYLPLRRAIAAYLASSRSVQADADQIIIVSGLQQGMKLLADSLMTPEDTIILEDPGYDGLLRTAQACDTNVTFTPIDEQGACVPGTERNGSLLVVCPSHQYPLGTTMPTARRLELIKWARSTNSYILEDDYDSEFRYAGRPLNSLQGISAGTHVIYGGSFSKATFPSLRMGYLVLPRHLIDQVRQKREATDSFPSIMPQLALTEFIEGGHFARHIRRLRKIHAARQAHFIQCFNEKLAPYFTIHPSSAGLDLVAWPSAKLAASTARCDTIWATLAEKAGLAALPISQAYRYETPQNALLLGFANFSRSEISAKTEKMARIMLSESGF